MKKAPPVRLSLRKLLIATLAVGPISILPSPLLAAIPASAPFTTTSGSATWVGAGNTGTINASNRAVLNWGTVTQGDNSLTSNFVIAAGETFNFVLPSGGAVLNRVTGNNATTGAALINGTLLSNGSVVILANGDITVGTGAQISTASGLVLSTLQENDFNFTANGSLALTGAPQGNIILGTGTGVASVIGNLAATANVITANNLTVSGDLILNSRGGSGLALTTASPTTVGGNLTVTTANTAITQGAGALVAATGNTSLSSGTAAITLATATNDFKTLTANTSGAGGSLTIVDANKIELGASNIGGAVSVTATGVANESAIATTGTLTIGGAAAFTSTTENSAVVIANNSTIAGVLTATTNNSNITFNGTGNLTTGAIASGQGTDLATDKQAAIVITTNGALSVGGAIANGAGNLVANITLTGTSITQNATGTISSGNGVVTLNATAGNIVTDAISARTVTLNASAGSINPAGQTNVITTSNTTGTSVVRASGSINLNGTNAIVAGQILQVPVATTANITNGPTILLGTSNVTGNLTLTSTTGNVVLGALTGTAAQNITVGGILTATTQAVGSDITDGDYSVFNIPSGLNLTATGNVILDAAVANGSLAPNVQFGQVRVTAPTGNVTIAERTTLNLGNITAANLSASSVAGDIVNSGDINVGSGTANFTTTGAGTTAISNATNTIGTVNFFGPNGTAGSGGSITAGSAGITLGSLTNVTPGDDVVITTINGGPVILAGSTVAGSLTVNSSGTINTGAGNTTVGGNLSLTAADSTANSILQSGGGRYVVTGVTSVASNGNVTLTQGNDFMGGVVLNQAASLGDVAINDLNNLTVSGVAGGFVNVQAGASALAIDAAWNLTLGNLTAGSLRAAAINGGGGNSGTITQSAGTSFHSEGNFTAVTNNGNIVLANNGNSAGRVAFFTNGATNNGTATISYTEDGTMRVGNLASNSNITLRSNFGSIVEDTNTNTVLNVRATLNATAPNGSILLGNTTTTTTTTTGNVANFIASAPSGAVAIQSNSNITLGAINANSLSVTAVNNITQSGVMNVFGPANFTSNSTTDPRNITLTNNSNNFGPISLSIGNNTGTIAVNEGNTLNLRRVDMPGGGNATFTASSINGDIMDSGFIGVLLGGNATTTGSGVVTLTATNGNIVFNDPSTDIRSSSGLVFNAKDVDISILGNATTSLVLGAASAPSAATGNLSVTSFVGSIANAGAITAGGMATFQTPSGNIIIGQSGVGFGVLKFIGNQISISEAGNMDIATGSTATGPVNLVSGGNIGIVNVGGGNVSFASTVNMTATGNINPANLLQAGGQLRVTHTGTADLSGLSITSNLNGITPIDGGTGTYVPPAP